MGRARPPKHGALCGTFKAKARIQEPPLLLKLAKKMPRFWKCWCSSTSVSPWCLGSLLFVGPVRSSFSAVLTDPLDQIPRYLQALHPRTRFIFLGHAYRSFIEFTCGKHNSSAAIKSGWPSGLRCQTQALVLERGHQIKVAIHTTWYEKEFVQWQPRCYTMIQRLWTIHARHIHRAHANLMKERWQSMLNIKKLNAFHSGVLTWHKSLIQSTFFM